VSERTINIDAEPRSLVPLLQLAHSSEGSEDRHKNSLTHSLTPWITVLEKLTVDQLFKKLPPLYGTLRFITLFR
jgi:hypothetical protein